MTAAAGAASGPPGQMALGVGFNAARRLSNFVAGSNSAVVDAMHAVADGAASAHVYLRGSEATGKTHLLQACCAGAQGRGANVAYLPMAARGVLDCDVLTGLAGAALVCVDDVDRIGGDPHWETALFNLYNEAEAHGARLVFSGRAGPPAIALPDLRSRLQACLMLVLSPADDAVRRRVLVTRASELGFELGDDAVDYILARQPRDLGRLTALVEALDRFALAAKRRVTVALVREFLASDPGAGRT